MFDNLAHEHPIEVIILIGPLVSFRIEEVYECVCDFDAAGSNDASISMAYRPEIGTPNCVRKLGCKDRGEVARMIQFPKG
jgi:hypothetical protein